MINILLPRELHADPLIDLLYLIPLGALLGIAISLSHSFSGNIWLRQRNYMMLSMILPVVALVITKSISSNIFLSLGMIGALSIDSRICYSRVTNQFKIIEPFFFDSYNILELKTTNPTLSQTLAGENHLSIERFSKYCRSIEKIFNS